MPAPCASSPNAAAPLGRGGVAYWKRTGARRPGFATVYAGGFTLVELMVVMTLLAVVISVALPSLSHFFRGRALDSEARRVLSLTRYGQSRAASEGVPQVMWLDTKGRRYGLIADPSYTPEDGKAVDYTLDTAVELQIQTPGIAPRLSSTPSLTVSSVNGPTPLPTDTPQLRFMPDGSIDESSPEAVLIRDQEGGALVLGLTRNRLSYEIRAAGNN